MHVVPRWAFGADWVEAVSAVAVLYLACVRRARRSGHVVTTPQIVCFLAGLGAVLAAFLTKIDTYDNVDFVDHVTQHLILVFVAAPLVALGAPIEVVARGAPGAVRRRLLDPVLRSRFLQLVSAPVGAGVLFLVVQAGVFIPPLFNGALNTGTPHVVQHLLLLVSGFLFWRSIATVEPEPSGEDRPRRFAVTGAVVALTVGLGIVLVTAATPLYRLYVAAPRPWGGEEAFDLQRAAGWVQVLGGGTLAVLAIALTRRLRPGVDRARNQGV